MAEAIRRAAALVAHRGELALALYRRTWLCPFWKLEKRWYAGASPRSQEWARGAYLSLFKLAYALTGRNFHDHVSRYKSSRGMDFFHDVHDWLGGYPYESASRSEIESLISGLGFRARIAPRQWHRPLGLLGSGCDEYVYTKTA
jgi:2-polyprenyl-6-hydroxyphenyl methylase/3-demethylubiquinone-9 3-methyltransferase